LWSHFDGTDTTFGRATLLTSEKTKELRRRDNQQPRAVTMARDPEKARIATAAQNDAALVTICDRHSMQSEYGQSEREERKGVTHCRKPVTA
jgi:hypothetical protein